MVTGILILALIYLFYRNYRHKKLEKRIEILEKRVDKLEKEVRFVVLYLDDK
jgi:Tfp pilus assembly protein PilN